MAILTVVNRSSSRLPVSATVGILSPNEQRQVELTVNELETIRAVLVALAAASLITWSVSSSSSDEDNQAETVLGGARVLTGTGSPESVVVGSVGDLFTRKDGGVSTTLYVKESGNETNTGWAAK